MDWRSYSGERLMLNLTATLVGKSSHRDGGYVLTFMVQGQEFKFRVTGEQGKEFADTASLVHPEGVGEVKTVHSVDLQQYQLTIGEFPKKAKAVPAKPADPEPKTGE